mgnify:FL=1
MIGDFYLNCNQKRCFTCLLLFNFILALIYYIHQQNYLILIRNYRKAIPFEHNIFLTRAIAYLRHQLENDYDRNDLHRFYRLVENEFSLGLRCVRKTNSQISLLNTNLTINESNQTTTTTTASSIVVKNARLKRTDLYSFTISNSDACANDSIDLVVIIISKSENYKTRDAIRRTWASGKQLGNYSLINLKFFFLLDFDEKLTSNIRLENKLFRDIIQVELPQQYTLVTHRVLALFEWTFRFCRKAKYLFKTDDDIFINLILLLKFIRPNLDSFKFNNSFQIADMQIYGYKHYYPRVFRQASDPVSQRYVITEDEFPCGNYPDFLSGFGYLIPRKARDALVYASYHDFDLPFRISDVYLT